VSDDERVERALRDALREAAEQVEAQAPSPGDRPRRRSDQRRAFSRRAPLAVTAGLLTVTVLVAVFVLTGRADEATIATDPEPPGQVEPTDVGLDEADLVVVMATNATADQLAAVREAIAASPDVVRFSEVTSQQALQELAAAVCPDPNGIDGDVATEKQRGWVSDMLVTGPGGIPTSFWIVIDDGDLSAGARLRDSLATLPGVMSVAARGTDVSVPAEAGAPALQTRTFTVGPPPGGTSVGFVCSQGEGSPPDPGRRDGGTATPVPVPPTTAPTLPPPSGEEPADPEAARAAIIEAYTTATDGSLTVAERRAHIEDSDELGPYLDRAAAPYRDAVRYQTVTLGDIVFLDAERAALVYTLSFGGRLPPQTDVGYAVLDEGRWKVSRETVCALILRAGVTCPPRAPS
jgi:hypothetical protein